MILYIKRSLIFISSSLMLFAFLFGSSPIFAQTKIVPKYILYPIDEQIPPNSFIEKIHYYRRYNPTDGFEHSWFHCGSVTAEEIIHPDSDYTSWEANIQNNGIRSRIYGFAQNKVIKGIEIGADIENRLDNLTRDLGYSVEFKRKGILILSYQFALVFPTTTRGDGRTVAEVRTVYDSYDPIKYQAHFENMVQLLVDIPSQRIEIVGSASASYVGSDSDGGISFNDNLARARTIAGVNFILAKFLEKTGRNLNVTFDTTSLRFTGPESNKIVCKSNGITSNDVIDDAFVVDQAITFRLKN